MESTKMVAVGVAAAATAATAAVAGIAAIRNRHTPPVYHVKSREDGWAVMAENAERASSLHSTKREAVQAGRSVATERQGRLVIHRQDGTVMREHSYATG